MSDSSGACEISVVVVAADSGPLLHTCVASVLASDASVELVLVDNGSTDGELEQLMATYAAESRLHVLRNDANLGFGPACNRGAAIARGDVLIFLNPDCVVMPHVVSALRIELESSETIGLLGATVCEENGSPSPSNRRRDPTLFRSIATISGMARFEADWSFCTGVNMPASTACSDIEIVEAVSGACMVIRRTLFKSLKGFDEQYFLHVEDLDLCRRVRDAGFQVAVTHALSVIHVGGSSSRHRPLFVARHKHRGMWRYFNKFDPAARNPLLRECVRAGLALHYVVVAMTLATKSMIDKGLAYLAR